MNAQRRCRRPSRPSAAGFTLIEIVVVIVISAIIAGILSVIIRRPIEGFDAQVQRAELVDVAESALRRMQRDVRAALPNSVRLRTFAAASTTDAFCPNNDSICVLEILHTVEGGRYRAGPPGMASNILQFGTIDTDFDVIGTLQNIGSYTTAQKNSFSLIVNNQTTSGIQYNAYFGDNRTLLTGATTTATHISMAGKNFAATLASPRQRFYIVDTPVTYRCNTGTGRLDRYEGYPIVAAQPETPVGGPVPARAANLIVGCRFTYQSGVSARAGLLTLELTVQGSNANEPIRLLHQVHVYNIP